MNLLPLPSSTTFADQRSQPSLVRFDEFDTYAVEFIWNHPNEGYQLAAVRRMNGKAQPGASLVLAELALDNARVEWLGTLSHDLRTVREARREVCREFWIARDFNGREISIHTLPSKLVLRRDYFSRVPYLMELV